MSLGILQQDRALKEAFDLKKDLKKVSVGFCTNSHESCGVEETVRQVFQCIQRERGCNLACPHTTRFIILHPNTEHECAYIDKRHEIDADAVIKSALAFLKSQQDTEDLDSLYEYFDNIRLIIDLVVGSKQRSYPTKVTSERGKKEILAEVTDPKHKEWIITLCEEDRNSIAYKLALTSLKNWITQEALRIKGEVQKRIQAVLLDLQE